MNPFFFFQVLRDMVSGQKKKKKPRKFTPNYTKSKYYRGQDYDDHVYDRGEDHGLGDGKGADKQEKED